MSNFDSTKMGLGEILVEIIKGKIQLPDFQRGWIWDDEHIRSLRLSGTYTQHVSSRESGDARIQTGLEWRTYNHPTRHPRTTDSREQRNAQSRHT